MEQLWVNKYAPQKFDEMILPEKIRQILKRVIDGVLPYTMTGPPGVGKGTFTKIYLNEINADSLWINASNKLGIDAVSTRIKGFSNAMGLDDRPKVVVLNEFDSDNVSIQAQNALKAEIEEVFDHCRFVLVGNNINKISDAMQSRGPKVEITNPPAKEIYNHVSNILEKENIKVKSKKLIIEVIKKLYPDIRGIITTLQMNTLDGRLDSIEITDMEDIYKSVMDAIMKKDLDTMRSILRSNVISYSELYSFLFENAGEFRSPGDAIIEIGEHLYRDSIVSIKEINFVHMVVSMIKRKIV